MTSARRGDEDAARSSRAFAATATALIALLVLSTGFQIDRGPVPRWVEGPRATYRVLWPQGWWFFTGAADSAALVVHVQSGAGPGGARFTPLPGSQLTRSRLWGLSRVGDAQLLEVAQLAGAIPVARWARCGRPTLEECRGSVGPSPHAVVNRSRRPTLCGRLAIAQERPYPDSGDRRLPDRPRYVDRVALADVSCPG